MQVVTNNTNTFWGFEPLANDQLQVKESILFKFA